MQNLTHLTDIQLIDLAKAKRRTQAIAFSARNGAVVRKCDKELTEIYKEQDRRLKG